MLGHPAGTRSSLSGVGALIESPALYPHLSGRDNLRILAGYASVPPDRIGKVLEEVGMTAKADVAFRAYSLGMKQRLAVAAALLKDPVLLILDEPTNGLDPEGVAGMRDLITGLRRDNRTVLLSSHLLSEVELLCDRVGVIRRGRLVADGTVAGLRATAGTGALVVRADPADRAPELLRAHEAVSSAERDGGELRVSADPDAVATVNRDLLLAGVEVSELRLERHSLEEVFRGSSRMNPASPWRRPTRVRRWGSVERCAPRGVPLGPQESRRLDRRRPVAGPGRGLRDGGAGHRVRGARRHQGRLGVRPREAPRQCAARAFCPATGLYPLFGSAMMLLLGTILIGGEYRWGTLGTLLTQGPSRAATVLAKWAAVAAAALCVVVALFAALAVASLIVAEALGKPVRWPDAATILGDSRRPGS